METNAPWHRRALRTLRRDYFNSPWNILLTLAIGGFAVWALVHILGWAVFKAVWMGESNQVRQAGGATWAFVGAKLRFFLFGFYPKDQIWRIPITIALLGASCVPYFLKTIRHKVLIFAVHLILWPLIVGWLMGGGLGLPRVSSNEWGGLSLTLVLSALGLLFSFPLGILLALGRRSPWKVIRFLSIAYIEFFRGIPLITILFMASVVVPFFLPPGSSVDKMLRVVAGMTFFQSAYLAEVIRGGLQAIPKGQYEAADSLGFRFGLQNYLIIIPQVLKVTIANIGAISISFIKDTSLVLIIGMFDLLGVVTPLTSDSNWLGMEPEGLIFAGLVYWVLCFGISRFSHRAERTLNTLPATTQTGETA